MSKTKKKPAKKAAKKKPVQSLGSWNDTLESIKAKVSEMEPLATKFDNGTKAAAGKLRKAAMEIKRLCGDFRKQVQEAKANL